MIENVTRCWQEALRLLTLQMTEAACDKVKQAQQQFRQAKAVSNRMKIDELNESILSLNVLILQMERQLSDIRSMCPDVMMTSAKQFVIELKQRKGELEVQKRVIARARGERQKQNEISR